MVNVIIPTTLGVNRKLKRNVVYGPLDLGCMEYSYIGTYYPGLKRHGTLCPSPQVGQRNRPGLEKAYAPDTILLWSHQPYIRTANPGNAQF